MSIGEFEKTIRWGTDADMDDQPQEIVGKIARLLDSLQIAYQIGGSLAAAAHGIPRTTNDAGFVVDLRRDQVETLAHALEAEYYVSREAMAEAVRDRDSFNAIHFGSGFKVDFFILGTEPFDREEFRRSVKREIPAMVGQAIMFKTPEDTILRKLLWFRAGREVSDQQWRDILGILLVSGPQLDNRYLDGWAAQLGVPDLFSKARKQSTQP